MLDLRVTLGSLTLTNPVLAAAGTFGYGLEFAPAVRLERLGALVTKTLTRQPRDGNPPPRLVETPAGMLNSVGLSNVGLEPFLREKLQALRRIRVPVIVSVLGESPEELAGMVRQLDQADGAAAIEVNLSCPNFAKSQWPKAEGQRPEVGLRPPASGLRPVMVAQDADATFQMVSVACAQTRKPVIAKLTPDVTDLVPIAQAAERAGAAALTIGNTFAAMSIDPATRRSRLSTLTGGLSGPAIRPLAVYRVWYTAQSVAIPVIGLGGIVRAEDAVEFFCAGASAVAVGTAHFADPSAAVRVAEGLARYLRKHGMASVHDLRGAVNRG